MVEIDSAIVTESVRTLEIAKRFRTSVAVAVSVSPLPTVNVLMASVGVDIESARTLAGLSAAASEAVAESGIG